MAIIRHEFIYGNDLASVGVFHSRCFTDSLCDGNIVAVRYKAAGVTDFIDDWYLGLKVEGSSALLGADRIHITSGDLSVENTSISIPVLLQNRFQPEILARGGGVINGPIVIIIDVDDGVNVPNVGDPVGGGTANSVLYVDPTGDLGQDPTRFAYQQNEGDQGSLKLGDVADSTVDSGIDKSKSLLQVVDHAAYSGNLDRSYFGIFSSITRGGNNSFFQTSAVRGRARYSGSSPDGPIVTGIEAFVDNQGSTNNSHGLQGLEGNVEAVENANDIQGVAAFGSVADNKTITEFAIGILANMIAGAGSTVPLLIGVRALAGLGGTIAQAIGLLAVISRGTAGVTTDLYGIKIEVDGSTGTVTNSYGIFIPAEIDAGVTIKRAIKSLSTAISEFAGEVHVPDDPYDATTWNGSTAVPTKNAVRDEIEAIIAAFALDSAVVHKTGVESIAGMKTFTSIPLIPDDAYDAITWDANLGLPTKNALRDKIEAIVASISGFAADAAVVHNTGAETIAGVKTFSSAPVIPADPYGSGWNGTQEPAPKDAVYDKIETILAAGGYSDEQAQDAIGAMLDTTLEYVDATPLLRRAALTGDVTAGAGSNATTIANAAVTLVKMANLAANSILGNNTGAGATPIALTPAQVRTLLGLVIGTNVQAWDADLDTWATKTAPAGVVLGTTDTQTLTNKRITPRVSTTASSATPTPNADTDDLYKITAQAAAAAFAAPSGTPDPGQPMMIRIKDNGTARALTWDAIYRVVGVTLPTTTVISKTLYIGMMYNADDTKWDVLAVNQQA